MKPVSDGVTTPPTVKAGEDTLRLWKLDADGKVLMRTLKNPLLGWDFCTLF
jgi:hypothetical protein